MFDRDVDYPVAVSSYTDEGVEAAIDWCVEHIEDGDTLSVWTALKSNLENCSALDTLVRGHSNVEHITGRGSGYPSGPGPVLMAWADMDDIGKLVRHGRGIRALCVINWNEKWLQPWVTAVKPTILGDASLWEDEGTDLDPVLVEALKSMTLVINHNNTISAGFEKDIVVSSLLALRAARIPMDGEAIQAWALAHGWAGKNPQRLAKYVDEINAGKRPRSSYTHGPDYVEHLRARAAGEVDEE
jgi:hypothetical protein